MNSIDLISILGNISHSLYPIQKLISGIAYLLGILFFLYAIDKLRQIADKRAQSSSQEKVYTPMMYILFGALLLYLPSALTLMANTAFGVGNVIGYSNYSNGNIVKIVDLFIRTAGGFWFIRGCVLVAHASNPGAKHGIKGLFFIIAGILAINFDSTVEMSNSMLERFVSWTLTLKSSQGY